MKRMRKYWFLFRWFLIGKNHCEISADFKRFWFVVHKLLWASIVVSMALMIAHIVEALA